MSLAATASNWTNDNIQPKKRVSTIGRPSPSTIEETENLNEETGARVNKLLDVLASDNVGNGLANYEPIHKPIINVRRKIDAQDEDDEYDEEEKKRTNLMFSANDANLGKLSNYNQTYMAPPIYQSRFAPVSATGIGDDRLMEKINYMIHMLEEQQIEKTSNITEEFILYTFLGIFVIFTVDSFTRAGKYVR
jgi:hypothetical protein